MPTDASDWLQFAQGDLAAARTLLSDPDIPSRIACFHAQQSAEKALKAPLVASSIPFKKTHDLVVLAGLQDVEISAELASIDLLLLHPWAVEARYPGALPDASDDEAAEVVSTAANVFGIAARRIRPMEPPERCPTIGLSHPLSHLRVTPPGADRTGHAGRSQVAELDQQVLDQQVLDWTRPVGPLPGDS